MKQIDSKYWSLIIFILLVSVGVALAMFVHRNTTDISDALAAEVLEQQSDVALLLHEYDALRLAIETARLSAGKQAPNKELANKELESALVSIENQLDVMRFNYSFQRLDGAATAHAYIKPVVEDVRQWLGGGIPGLGRNDDQAVAIASKRILERYQNLRAIAEETNQVANELVNTQTGYLTRFGKSLMFLLGAYALLAVGITSVLMRQRNLQSEIVAVQRRHADRIKDFADTGADWFWELNPGFQLRMLSGKSLFGQKSNQNSKPAHIPDSKNAIAHPARAQLAIDLQLPPLERDIVDDHWPIQSLYRHEEFKDFETEWVANDGSVNILSISGKPLIDENGEFKGYRGIGRDITERRKIETELEKANQSLIEAETRSRQHAEQALKDSEVFLRTSLNALPQCIAIFDSDGIVQEANTAWVENSSSDRKALLDSSDEINVSDIGQHYSEVLYSQAERETPQLTETAAKIEWCLNGYAEGLRTEVPIVRQGDSYWLAIAFSPFVSNQKRYGVLVIEEITDRKLLEEQDRQMRAELAHFSRLTTVGELATGLAHELNQPLTAIAHNCDALMSGLGDNSLSFDADDIEAISEINSEAKRAGAIIKGLRKMVRKETGAVLPTDINQLVAETMRLSMPDANKHGITVKLNLADNLPAPEIDSVQIQQVLVNLERNAVDAMRLSDAKLREMVISTAEDENGFVRVTVQDSGGGFSDEVQNKLFSPFLTTKKGGIGMGLSISRSIIESHGGQLWVDFSDPVMTTFNFTLPAFSEAATHGESGEQDGQLSVSHADDSGNQAIVASYWRNEYGL